MTTRMTPESASALRKPFDPKAVGVLPKPLHKDAAKGRCNECGGYHGLPAVHLDYVGHAATTDRLLSVDPEWNYQIVTVDDSGNPLPGRGLWIKLTVCGVTRYGFGDGSSIKECIGDAIRNAAMRFGVALDLWSKEELEQAHGPAIPQSSGAEPGETAPAEPAAAPTGSAADEPSAPEPVRSSRPPHGQPFPAKDVSDAQVRMMQSICTRLGMNREDRLSFAASVLGHPVESYSTLTSPQASRLIEALQKLQGTGEVDA